MRLLLALSATVLAIVVAPAQAATRNLIVAMHDPGCHWFLVHGHYLKAFTAHGSVRLVNRDEATLKVASRHRLWHIRVGGTLNLHRGSYVVLMVGQEAGDNVLRLEVR